MPELPDVTIYIEALERRTLGARLDRIRLFHPFVLRSVAPPLSAVTGQEVRALRRLGKRIVIELDSELFVVIHLMIAGRLHWKLPGSRPPGKIGLAAFDFSAPASPATAPPGGTAARSPASAGARRGAARKAGAAAGLPLTATRDDAPRTAPSSGTLILTEAGTKRRAAIFLVAGGAALREHDPGGVEVLQSDLEQFRETLARENHTLKRALTDPTILAGIGNAYSDEILHRAQLSPVKQTRQLSGEEIARLFEATRATVLDWCERLRQEAGDDFPEGVTAFRPGMAVHGRYGRPCPRCGTPVQRVVYAENETNYCPRCQTGGRLLADRSLSRLMRGDWPRTLEELEERRRGVR